MIGRVLVGLGGRNCDGVCYTDSATRMAVDIARAHESSVTGVTVADVAQLRRVGPAPIGAGAAVAELREHRVAETRERVDAAIKRFHEVCSLAETPCHVLCEERSEPFDYLISQARYHDLTVIGLRGLFEFGVYGEAHYDAAASLLRLIQAGVRPIIAAGPEPRSVERILVTYSGSNESAKAMRRFVQMRLWPDAAVRIVAFGDDHERRQRHLLHAANYCEAHGIEAERDYRPGSAKTGILEAAQDWDADLIVMGNSHRTLLARRVLGDTLTTVIQQSDLPLFLSQ